MKISFTTSANNLNLTVGYGIAGYNICTALKRLGHEVPFQDSTAKVEIGFCMPEFVEWSNPDAYHILYFPWESTTIPENWKEPMNDADELWVTSAFVRDVVENEGFKVTTVYEHGVDSDWKAIRRTKSDPLRFLMIGGEAPRKNADMTWKAFRDAFGDNTDVHLTVKSTGYTTNRIYDKQGSILGVPYNEYKNMTNIHYDLEFEQLLTLYRNSHVMVYPSYGEGFGMIPLQALATGMPTICTENWAPYKGFLHPELSVPGRLEKSFTQNLHPGSMFTPDYDRLVQSLVYAYENYQELADWHYDQAPDVHKHYDWDRLTKNAFEPIIRRFDNGQANVHSG